MKEGWVLERLGELCKIINGGTPKTGVPEFWGGPHLWLTPAEMGRLRSPFKNSTKRTLTDLGLARSSAQLAPAYSVILSTRAPIGHLVINTSPMATNQGCKTLVPDTKLEYKYLFYYLYSIKKELDALGEGATFKELSATRLKKVEIPFPQNRCEQQRIVAILDAAFADIATAKAHAERNLANAGEIFDSELNHVFNNLNTNCTNTNLGQVCTFENGDRGANYPSKSKQTSSGIPFINAGHLTKEGISFEKMNYIPRAVFNKLGSGKIKKNDLLFCLRGSLGKFSCVGELESGAIASSLIIVRPKISLLSGFLMLYFGSNLCAKMIERYKNGAAQPNLGAASLKKFYLDLPSIPEQQRIVARLDELSAHCKKLEALYRRKIALYDELKQSLLAKAFRGELC